MHINSRAASVWMKGLQHRADMMFTGPHANRRWKDRRRSDTQVRPLGGCLGLTTPPQESSEPTTPADWPEGLCGRRSPEQGNLAHESTLPTRPPRVGGDRDPKHEYSPTRGCLTMDSQTSDSTFLRTVSWQRIRPHWVIRGSLYCSPSMPL